MEFRSIEQLAKNQRDLPFDNARPVVLNPNFIAIGFRCLDMDPDFRKKSGFFTRIERIVDRLLDGG